MGPRKNIVFIVSSMQVGGAERILADLIVGIADQGYHPHLICLKRLDHWGGILKKQGIACYTINIKRGRQLHKILSLIKAIRTIRPCLIYSLDHRDAILLSRMLSFILSIPHVSSQHSLKILGAEAKNQFGYKLAYRVTTPMTTKIIAVGNAVRRALLDFKVPAKKIKVIYNGLRISQQPIEKDRAIWRERLGLEDNDNLVGIVAALRPTKDHGLFLEAARIVIQECPHTYFAVVGEGYLLPDLIRLSQSLKISERVFFLGSITPANPIIRAFDIGVLSSTSEAFPMVLLEYMEAGKPVVSTSKGGPSEIIVNEQTGFLVDANDCEQLSKKIVCLLKDEKLMAQMGTEGRKRVKSYFSNDRMIKKNIELFQKLETRKFHKMQFTNQCH